MLCCGPISVSGRELCNGRDVCKGPCEHQKQRSRNFSCCCCYELLSMLDLFLRRCFPFYTSATKRWRILNVTWLLKLRSFLAVTSCTGRSSFCAKPGSKSTWIFPPTGCLHLLNCSHCLLKSVPRHLKSFASFLTKFYPDTYTWHDSLNLNWHDYSSARTVPALRRVGNILYFTIFSTTSDLIFTAS